MGLSVRRSVRIGKNTRLNLSKSGIGISTGAKGVRISAGPRGIRKSVGIPGTGVYYTKQSSWKASDPSDAQNYDDSISQPRPVTRAGKIGYRILAVLLFLIALFLFLCGIAILPIGIIVWLSTAIFTVLGVLCIRKTK